MTDIEAQIEWITQELLRHCGPILIGPSLKSCPDRNISNGTYSLIDTGTKHLLITCCHVWDAYVEKHDQNPDSNLGLLLADGSTHISFRNPERHLISFDRQLDLAVFDFSPSSVPVPCEKSPFLISKWPPPMPQPDDFIVTLGFSGAWRSPAPNGFVFGFAAIPLKVSAVSDRTIAAFFDEDNAEVLTDMRDCWGGFSGSPVYRFDDNCHLHLVAFVKAGPMEKSADNHDSYVRSNSLFSGGVLLSRADFLLPNGEFRHLS